MKYSKVPRPFLPFLIVSFMILGLICFDTEILDSIRPEFVLRIYLFIFYLLYVVTDHISFNEYEKKLQKERENHYENE